MEKKIRKEIKYSSDEWDKIIELSAKSGKLPAAYIRDIVRNYNEDKIIIKDYEFIVENADRYFELLNADPPTPNHKLFPYRLFYQLNIDSKEKVKFYVNHLEKMKSEFAETQEKYDKAVAEKKEVDQSSGITPPNGSKSTNQALNRACACCSKFSFMLGVRT